MFKANRKRIWMLIHLLKYKTLITLEIYFVGSQIELY
jgi:hypothetical protein